MPQIKLEALPPEEAIAFFRQKGYKIGFDWRDVWQQEHQAAFTVAKAMQLDILRDIRAAVDSALVDGTTFDTFRKNLKPLLVQKGWWGRADMKDPLTGEVKNVQLGSTRRLKTIYDTNLRTAHSEGQWERIQESKDAFPYLQYDGNNSEHPRIQHAAWDGMVLPVDDPFWQSHMPVKEWGCKCRVNQMSGRMLERRGLTVNDTPKVPTSTYVNQRTGETQQIPQGVHPAFHYPPGGRLANLPKMITDKLDATDVPLASGVVKGIVSGEAFARFFAK
ncbi:MAG: phage minor head protein, partial [Pseudomonadota bacterium]